MMRVLAMTSTTSLYFYINYLAASQSTRLGPWTQLTTPRDLSKNLIQPQNLNPLGYFLLDCLSNIGILLALELILFNLR